MTVEVGSIDEEACSLDHIFCDHTQTVQNIAQLTEKKKQERGRVTLILSQEIILSVVEAELQRYFYVLL